MRINHSHIVDLKHFTDDRGKLSVGQFPGEIPFKVERFFVISRVPRGESRGVHAHKKCHQLLICLSGQIKALVDDGKKRFVVNLTEDSEALYMPPLTWGTQYEYSEDAILLVLASHVFDRDDYINDYQEFLSFIE